MEANLTGTPRAHASIWTGRKGAGHRWMARDPAWGTVCRPQERKSHMITRNYTDTDGKSRFEDLPLPFVQEEGRERTPLQRATGIRFHRWPVGQFRDWHNAPRRQYVIILAGHVEVGLEDGTVH